MACDLYVGAYFTNAFDWAKSVAPLSDIYILSAKYGLIKSTQLIDSYDLKLGHPNSVDQMKVSRQAIDLGISNEQDVVVVGGQKYVSLAKSVFPNARAPFGKGGRFLRTGMGYQISNLVKYKGVRL